MDTRKDYVAPAIAAEDALEQTSLACTMTSAVLTYGQCAGQINQKNGGFWDGLCDAPVLYGTVGIGGVVSLCEPAYPDNVTSQVELVLGTAFS